MSTIGRRRAVVLGVLHEAVAPVSVGEVARRTGLHVNTARFHLERLVSDGLAARAGEARATPGRPRILYVAAEAGADPRSYALLAEMLTGLIAELPDAAPVVAHTGRAWGGRLVDPPAHRVDAAEATARVVAVLDAIGFRPEVQAVPDGVHLLLHHCPFREVAERHADVVCGMHLALIEGALEELRAPLRATGLDPFVGPSLCRARLSRVD